MSDKKIVGEEARRLLLSGHAGVLSTHSLEMEGFPFTSIVPFCLNSRGEPVILISSIAQHTKNISANPKVSLFVQDSKAADVQASSRLSLMGVVTEVREGEVEAIAARYYSYYPDAVDYHKTHDFDFYVLSPLRSRYIGGFGKIHWLENQDLLLPNPFTVEQEQSMVAHMNEDHKDAIHHYCNLHRVQPKSDVEMVGIDSEGIHLLHDHRIERIPFTKKVTTPLEAREMLVEMARA